MPLELHPLEESDVPAYIDVMFAAFATTVMGLMYPNGFSPAARQHTIDSTFKSWHKHPDQIHKLKVIDTDLPEDDPYKKIVGISDWKVFPHERSEAELAAADKESEEDGMPPDINESMALSFFGAAGKAKKEHLGGRPYVYLHILATHPKHHRRGVGLMHLKYGFDLAEKVELPVWLESSPNGKPLYERNGFEVVGWMDWDCSQWTDDPEFNLDHALMLRPVKKTSEVRP